MLLRIFLVFTFICGLPLQGFAQDEPDLKAQFLSTWEEHQRSLPTTVILEKTEEPTIYYYETTLFPYKGKLKLNNILISSDLNYYYDYDLGVEHALKGVAEVELLDLSSENFFRKYPLSSQLWSKTHFLFRDETKKLWLSAEQWKNTEYLADIPNNSHGYQKPCILNGLLSSLLPILFVVIFLIILISRITKSQKKQFDKYDLSLERQLESLEIQRDMLNLQKDLVKALKQDDT